MAEQLTAQRPIVLTVNVIVDGRFIRAGDPTPYEREADLPDAMKAFIATGEEMPFNPGERNIYDMSPLARRQARQLEAAAAEKAWAEEVADTPLQPETAAVLEAEHDKHIGLAKAQMEYRQGLSDGIYKQLEEEAAAKVTQYYVRRGGAWGKVQNSKLKPGETVFVKRENGEMEAAGVINARGEPPPQEIIP